MQAEIQQVARLVRRCLERGARVEIEGLGVFRPQGKGRFSFQPATRPKVFLAYVQEDAAFAERLYGELRRAGFDPWMDRKKLLAGQNWPRSIEQAIEVADFFIACFSRRAIGKRGCFQAELRYALDCARRVPLDQTYLIPVRLEECRVPTRIRNKIQ
ncbi:MAG: toll/interleukin-1 receptor domain-containing protein, partial [Bryobacteraceae bacterium]